MTMNKTQILDELTVAIQEAEIYNDGLMADRIRGVREQLMQMWNFKEIKA